MKTVLFYFALLCSQISISQSFKGAVYDKEFEEPLPFTNISIKVDGEFLSGTATDFDGLFSVAAIPAGIIDVEISYVGYERSAITLVIEEGEVVEQNIYLSKASYYINEVVITAEQSLFEYSNCGISCCYVSCYAEIYSINPKKEEQLAGRELGAMKVFPNPSNGHQVQMEYLNRKEDEGLANVQLFTSSGKKIHVELMYLSEGLNRIQLPFIASLATGTYLLQVNLNGNFNTQLVTVIR